MSYNDVISNLKYIGFIINKCSIKKRFYLIFYRPQNLLAAKDK